MRSLLLSAELFLLLAGCGQATPGNGSALVRSPVNVIAAPIPLNATGTSNPVRPEPDGQTAPPAKSSGNARISANVMTVLHENIGAMHATFDGNPVTGLSQSGECSAIITTTQGNTAVSWKDLGNLAPRQSGNMLTFKVPVGDTAHILAVPAGQSGDRMNMALGVLDGNCSPEVGG